MKKQNILKIIASALAVCVAAGTVPTTAWAAENPPLEGFGYADTSNPGENQNAGETPDPAAASGDSFSDEGYTDGGEISRLEINDNLTEKTKYTVGNGHVYAEKDGSFVFLRLENVPEVDGLNFYISCDSAISLTMEAAGSNKVNIYMEKASVTLVGNGTLNNSTITARGLNKDGFTGEMNAIIISSEKSDRYDGTIYGECVYSYGNFIVGEYGGIIQTLTIPGDASLTFPENSGILFVGVERGHSDYLNIEGKLINNGEIIFAGTDPDDPSAFVESFGFSGTGTVKVSAASDVDDITNANSKVYDNNGFLDMTDGNTDKVVEFDADTPKSFYRPDNTGRLYYTPPAGDSPALLKACGIDKETLHIQCLSEAIPVTLNLEGDNWFGVECYADVILDGTGSFAGDIFTLGEFSVGESFEGELNARIAQQTIEQSGNAVSSTINMVVYGDYVQMDTVDILASNIVDENNTYKATLTVPKGAAYIIDEGCTAMIDVGSNYEKYLKIDGKMINNGEIEVHTDDVLDDPAAFIQSLKLSGSGVVRIINENAETTVDDMYTNDGVKVTYSGGELNFEDHTGDTVWGDHMAEYGYSFEEKDSSYVLTLKDFASPERVRLPADKPIVINSSGVCYIGELSISTDTDEANLSFGGDGTLTVNKKIWIQDKGTVTIAEGARIIANNGFSDNEGRLVVYGSFTAMCDETNRHNSAVYAGALEIADTGILNVGGSRGIWINRYSSATGFSLSIAEGGQIIADCGEYGLAVCQFGAASDPDSIFDIPEGYLPHGYEFITAAEYNEVTTVVTLLLALEGSQITVSGEGRYIIEGEGAEGYIVIHRHSADYDNYIPDPDNSGQHIKSCANDPGHSDSAEKHAYGGWAQTIAPTEASTGLEERTCSVCGGKESRILPMLKSIPVSLKTGTEVTLKNNVLTYGEPLSNLVFNEAEFVDANGQTVTGILAWKEAAAALDAGTTSAVWIFTPAEEKYAPLEGTAAITVNKAQNAPNMPGSAMDVPNSLKKAGDVPLPESWEWKAEDKEKALAAGVSVEAVAVYTGEDKGNYEKETVTVTITRSACSHAAGEILYTGEGEMAPTCTEDGLGHKECSLCGDVAESGIVVKALGHDWHITSEEAATAASEGKRVYTCSRCSQTREESIPKLSSEPGGDSRTEDVAKNSAELDSGISIKWKGSAIALKWAKTAGAEGYDIFSAQSGKKLNQESPVQTVNNGKTSVTITKIDGKKISGKKAYAFKLKAWKYSDGKKAYIGESRTYHIAGKENKKYTNVKKLKPKKKKYTLKKGRSVRIQVTAVKESKKKKLLPKSCGPALRYQSDNEQVAAVTQKGKVNAKQKGTCYIYVTALNGVRTKIKITVK